jgi:hypothetical protein
MTATLLQSDLGISNSPNKLWVIELGSLHACYKFNNKDGLASFESKENANNFAGKLMNLRSYSLLELTFEETWDLAKSKVGVSPVTCLFILDNINDPVIFNLV